MGCERQGTSRRFLETPAASVLPLTLSKSVKVIGLGQFWQANRLNLGMTALRSEGIFVVDGKIRKS